MLQPIAPVRFVEGANCFKACWGKIKELASRVLAVFRRMLEAILPCWFKKTAPLAPNKVKAPTQQTRKKPAPATKPKTAPAPASSEKQAVSPGSLAQPQSGQGRMDSQDLAQEIGQGLENKINELWERFKEKEVSRPDESEESDTDSDMSLTVVRDPVEASSVIVDDTIPDLNDGAVVAVSAPSSPSPDFNLFPDRSLSRTPLTLRECLFTPGKSSKKSPATLMEEAMLAGNAALYNVEMPQKILPAGGIVPSVFFALAAVQELWRCIGKGEEAEVNSNWLTEIQELAAKMSKSEKAAVSFTNVFNRSSFSEQLQPVELNVEAESIKARVRTLDDFSFGGLVSQLQDGIEELVYGLQITAIREQLNLISGVIIRERIGKEPQAFCVFIRVCPDANTKKLRIDFILVDPYDDKRAFSVYPNRQALLERFYQKDSPEGSKKGYWIFPFVRKSNACKQLNF